MPTPINNLTANTLPPRRRRRRRPVRRLARAGGVTVGLLALLTGWFAFAAHVNGLFERSIPAEVGTRPANNATSAGTQDHGPPGAPTTAPRRPRLEASPASPGHALADSGHENDPHGADLELCERTFTFGDESEPVRLAGDGAPADPSSPDSPPAGPADDSSDGDGEGPRNSPRSTPPPPGPRAFAQRGTGSTPPATATPIPGAASPTLATNRRAFSPTPLRITLPTPSFLPGGIGGASSSGGSGSAGSGASTPATMATTTPAGGDTGTGNSAPVTDTVDLFPDDTRPGTLVVTDWVLDGTDPIHKPVVVSDGGAINPGHSPGALSLTDNLDMHGGLLVIEMAGTGAGQYDQLLVSGRALLTDLVIEFSLLDGFVPVEGDLFDFLRVAEGIMALDIASVSFSGLPAYLGFALVPTFDLQRDLLVGLSVQITAAQIAAFASGGITTTAVPLPATLLLAGPALLLLVARRVARRGGPR